MKKFHYSLFIIHYSRREGITLIELLITIALLAVFSLLIFSNFLGRRSYNDLNSTAQQIAALLREAQSRSMAQASSTSWGVHFENSTTTAPFYALFFSGAYSSSTAVDYYRLPATVGYSTSSLASGASLDLTFGQLSGAASASTSITIYLLATPLVSSTINVASSGAVSY